jgi:hypothetical protein
MAARGGTLARLTRVDLPTFKIEVILLRHGMSLLFVFLASSLLAHAAPPSVCSLVTPAQVQSVIGGRVNAGESAPSGPEQRCNFSNGQAKSFYVSYAAIADLGPIGPMMAKRQALCAPEPGKTCETLHGVGEAANYTSAPGAYFVIFIYHGYICTVDASADKNGVTIPGVREPLIAVAKAVIAKM